MAKTNKKTRTQLVGNSLNDLANVRENVLSPLDARASDVAIEAAFSAFAADNDFAALAQAQFDHKTAEGLRLRVRALEKERKEADLALSMLTRDREGFQRKLDTCNAAQHVKRTSLKSHLLTSGKKIKLGDIEVTIAQLRKFLEHKFAQKFEQIIQAGLAADDEYRALVEEGKRLNQSIEKLSRKIVKAEKVAPRLEKQIARLVADAQKLDEAAWEVEGVVKTSSERI